MDHPKARVTELLRDSGRLAFLLVTFSWVSVCSAGKLLQVVDADSKTPVKSHVERTTGEQLGPTDAKGKLSLKSPCKSADAFRAVPDSDDYHAGGGDCNVVGDPTTLKVYEWKVTRKLEDKLKEAKQKGDSSQVLLVTNQLSERYKMSDPEKSNIHAAETYLVWGKGIGLENPGLAAPFDNVSLGEGYTIRGWSGIGGKMAFTPEPDEQLSAAIKSWKSKYVCYPAVVIDAMCSNDASFDKDTVAAFRKKPDLLSPYQLYQRY